MKSDAHGTGQGEQSLCTEVLLERYAAPGERDLRSIQKRVARALAAVELPAKRRHWAARFYRAMRSGFIPGGRINANAGTDNAATLINCFVQPVVDRWTGRDAAGRPGIQDALEEALLTMTMGGGVGLDLSPLRPVRARALELDRAPGDPLSVIGRFNEACRQLTAGGTRRGAQMAVLRIDHPDIEAFIDAKRLQPFETVNFSVALTDRFMRSVQDGGNTDLVHEIPPSDGEMITQDTGRRYVYSRRPSRELWRQLIDAAWHRGNPGLIFIDQVNRDNNLSWIESLSTSNPCGEQYLPAYGACDLGSINLVRLVRHAFTDKARFDFEALRKLVAPAVRALDNVLELSRWPLAQQAIEAHSKRRIGLGLTGLGDALYMLGIPYDGEPARALAAGIARALRDAAYEASSLLAAERGSFPLFRAEPFLRAPHAASRLPDAIKALIRRHGIRNSHLLSVAPAGTISIAFAGNVSSGIEPPFAGRFHRRRRCADGSTLDYELEDFAWRLYRLTHPGSSAVPPAWRDTLQISPQAQLAMLAAVQPFIDGAISKTIQVGPDQPRSVLGPLMLEAWRLGVKGVSLYRPLAEGHPILWQGDGGPHNTRPASGKPHHTD